MDYKRINNDINGNPRYLFHYSEFLSETDRKNYPLVADLTFKVMDNLDARHRIALKKARAIGGRVYRGKYIGGGIVVQSFNIGETIKQIKEIAK